MIVDWAMNCEKIFLTKSLTTKDPSESKSKYKQELVYVKYLHDVMQLDKNRCFDEWKLVTNGTSSLFTGDNLQLEVQFDKIYKKALNTKYSKINYKEKLQPIVIFKEELDFLNQVNVPIWVRQYWGCLLFYYKFENQNTTRVQKTTTLNSWCIRHTDIKTKRYGSVCQDAIAKYKAAVGCPVINDFVKTGTDRYPSYQPAFLVSKGTPAFIGVSLDDMDNFLALIQNPVRVCIKCGSVFTITPKTQKCLCDACYAEALREKNSSLEQFKRKSLTSIMKTCCVCGASFTASSKSKKEMCDNCYKVYRKKYKTDKKREERKKRNEQMEV